MNPFKTVAASLIVGIAVITAVEGRAADGAPADGSVLDAASAEMTTEPVNNASDFPWLTPGQSFVVPGAAAFSSDQEPGTGWVAAPAIPSAEPWNERSGVQAADDSAKADASEKDDSPDISKPGPDMGDFPNSAFTLPKGRIYFELAPFTLVAADHFTPAAYSVPFLFRYGLTNDVEFRLYGNGVTDVFGKDGTTGFTPLIFDLKVHMWDDKKKWLIPAASLEVFIQTNMASPKFRGGVQPSVSLNFDLPITKKINAEWSLGYASVQDAVDIRTGRRFVPRHGFIVDTFQKANLNVNQFSAQWALEYELTEKLQLFMHGYYNGAIFLQQGGGTVLGAGFFWQQTKRLVWFGSCNAGLDNVVAPIGGQLGFAFAM